MSNFDLRDSVIIVTGASSGIGMATARLLHAAGAHPVLAARRADRLATLGQELDGALAVPTDVTDQDAVLRLVERTLEQYGRIDGLVNNAGAALHFALDQLDLAAYRDAFELNVVSLLGVTQAVLPTMREQHFGRIVNVSSGTTRRAMPGIGGYASTKAAVNMLTAVMRVEFEPDGIAVTNVIPSVTESEFHDGTRKAGQEVRPGMVVHSAEYVGRVILRGLQTGEETLDIAFGPERPELTVVPEN
jgi:NADP-dependent 3-hydroxy acid dehydrogenase YdfG